MIEQWEYKVVRIWAETWEKDAHGRTPSDLKEAQLGALGCMGWELVAIDGERHWIFKRLMQKAGGPHKGFGAPLDRIPCNG